MMKKKPYTEMIAYNVVTGHKVRGIISGDCVTLRIDVFDSLENWVVFEDGKLNPSRPLTYS